MEDLFVAVSSPPHFDEALFVRWVQGKTPEDIFNERIELWRNIDRPITPEDGKNDFRGFQFRNKYSRVTCEYPDLIRQDVQDQYHMFTVLEHYICQPLLLDTQMMVQIPQQLQSGIIETYWRLDDSVVREVIYKRLTKSRKDLDDVSESTGFNLRTVTRQFDNIKRIYSAVEDNRQWQCNLFDFIEKSFCLSSALTQRYSCILFLLYSKFNLTSKRRMQRVPLDALERCGALTLSFLASDGEKFSGLCNYLLMQAYSEEVDANAFVGVTNGWDYAISLADDDFCWTLVWRLFRIVDAVELEKQLLVNLRDLRTLLTGQALDLACTLVRNAIAESDSCRPIVKKRFADDSKIRQLLKSLMTIGGHLSQMKEFRDVLEDLMKFAEPLEEAGLSSADINSLFLCLTQTARAIPDSGRGTTVSVTAPVTVSGPRSSSSSSMSLSPDGLFGGITRMNTSRSIIREYSYSISSSIVDDNAIRGDVMRFRGLSGAGKSEIAAKANAGSGIGTALSLGTMKKPSKADAMRRDWLRFLTFSRLCTLQLITVEDISCS